MSSHEGALHPDCIAPLAWHTSDVQQLSSVHVSWVLSSLVRSVQSRVQSCGLNPTDACGCCRQRRWAAGQRDGTGRTQRVPGPRAGPALPAGAAPHSNTIMEPASCPMEAGRGSLTCLVTAGVNEARAAVSTTMPLQETDRDITRKLTRWQAAGMPNCCGLCPTYWCNPSSLMHFEHIDTCLVGGGRAAQPLRGGRQAGGAAAGGGGVHEPGHGAWRNPGPAVGGARPGAEQPAARLAAPQPARRPQAQLPAACERSKLRWRCPVKHECRGCPAIVAEPLPVKASGASTKAMPK